ncbi:hypothetical protein DIURU_004408 [Diutina rugosa]|uniref:Uncharacterized protein n=1 Tax=Diutina rugosa TaxID=5481 RepID=A0A642ULU4_DIURU|nr:uncharacterized protein DIURU_004408 [Diutina rugosa]KAA8899226.1 hypothetical protein DIURU_004408 [Diutina rugosa]
MTTNAPSPQRRTAPAPASAYTASDAGADSAYKPPAPMAPVAAPMTAPTAAPTAAPMAPMAQTYDVDYTLRNRGNDDELAPTVPREPAIGANLPPHFDYSFQPPMAVMATPVYPQYSSIYDAAPAPVYYYANDGAEAMRGGWDPAPAPGPAPHSNVPYQAQVPPAPQATVPGPPVSAPVSAPGRPVHDAAPRDPDTSGQAQPPASTGANDSSLSAGAGAPASPPSAASSASASSSSSSASEAPSLANSSASSIASSASAPATLVGTTTMVNSNPEYAAPVVDAVFVDPRSCTVCGRRILRDMARHMRTHQETPRFVCMFHTMGKCTHKSGRFNRPYDFKKHLLNRHFKFDDPKIKQMHNLSDKLDHFGECGCGFKGDGKRWLDDHMLTSKPTRCSMLS